VTVRCPTCGAEVEFRFDDSFVRVCGHCRSAVVRGDRGVETLGAFADLVPIQSPLRLFAEGRYGSTGFLLIGMAQLRHAAGGVWQEWYARLDGGQWAWIAEAQGRMTLTFERPDIAAPPFAELARLAPGTQIALGGAPFTVAERSSATYISALGEIPYRLVPNSSFQFVDLSDGRGGFATIDYGDGSEPPAVHLGSQVTPQGLGISGGEAAPVAPGAPSSGVRLACPHCNGSLELRAPDQSLRVACPYCASLVSVEGGTLSIIARQAKRPAPDIALGSVGRFLDGELTVIGHVARSAYIDGQWWPFEEYLLHAPGVGFRWLVRSDGHWSYVQPVATGAVTPDVHPVYDGVTFRRFQVAELRVDSVVGEFYWRVEAGERVTGEDYIAPPAMLSREVSASEQNWSLSTYVTPREVERAFGPERKLQLAPPTGVAPNQPYPAGVGKVAALVGVAFLAVGLGKCASSPATEVLRQRVRVPASAASAVPDLFAPTGGAAPGAAAGSGASGDPPGAVTFSEPFRLEGGRNVAFDLSASLSNNWIHASLDLVNDDVGSLISFDQAFEYYSGVDGGESWSEGSERAREVIAPVAPGNYVLRIEAQHGGVGSVDLEVVVRQGVFRGLWFWIFLAILAVPFLAVAIHALAFRHKRWENSNVGARASSGSSDDSDSGDDE
jgi:Domain of unknown function (DUF4178)